MENELELNLDDLDQVEQNADKKLQVRNRFQQLANAKTEAQQKAEAESKARADAEAKAQEAEKRVEFYKNFSQLSSKHPGAVDYQDQIYDRFSKGLDMEEATLGILAKEGKLGSTPNPQEVIRPEGGSALNSMEGPKDLQDMNQNDMLDSLKDFEKTGDLQRALRGGINVG